MIYLGTNNFLYYLFYRYLLIQDYKFPETSYRGIKLYYNTIFPDNYAGETIKFLETSIGGIKHFQLLMSYYLLVYDSNTKSRMICWARKILFIYFTGTTRLTIFRRPLLEGLNFSLMSNFQIYPVKGLHFRSPPRRVFL